MGRCHLVSRPRLSLEGNARSRGPSPVPLCYSSPPRLFARWYLKKKKMYISSCSFLQVTSILSSTGKSTGCFNTTVYLLELESIQYFVYQLSSEIVEDTESVNFSDYFFLWFWFAFDLLSSWTTLCSIRILLVLAYINLKLLTCIESLTPASVM